MTCQHLRPLEQALLACGARETYRGQAWSQNCREWVYFDCYIDTAAVRRALALAECVAEHAHRGTHDGQERGFVCTACHDGVMGRYEPAAGVGIFDGSGKAMRHAVPKAATGPAPFSHGLSDA